MENIPAKYVAAEDEAIRFLASVQKMRNRWVADEHFRRYHDITGSKETAAVKRASLDLTRSLAELRKYSG